MVKSHSPLFSILLPTHNRADAIGACIESVIAQSESDWELLIVGDGCTDDTEQVVQRYCAHDVRIRWYPFPKGPGFGYAHRNTVMDRACGKYVAFAAHDDLWFPDHLEHFRTYFDMYPSCQFACSRPLWVHPNGRIIPSLFNITDIDVFDIFMTRYNEISANSVVFTLEAMRAAGSWDDRLPDAADLALWRKIITNTSPNYTPTPKVVGYIPTPTTLHTRAIWRKTDDAWNAQLHKTYDALCARPHYLQTLCVSPEENIAQSWSIWNHLKDASWAESVRRNSQALIDAIARDSLSETRSFSDLDRVRSTRGYRTLEKLRKIRTYFAQLVN
jgi:glycosyltransferase involved in cell wall biosynthesis